MDLSKKLEDVEEPDLRDILAKVPRYQWYLY